MDSSNPLLTLIVTYRLRGPNFYDWLRNLRIVLSLEKIEYVLDNQLPMKEVQESANEEEKIAYGKWRDDDKKARCYMLASMNTLLQKQHFKTESAYEILLQLQKMYEELGVDRYSISKKLFSMRMPFGTSVKDHVLEMVSYIQQLEKFGAYMSEGLAANLILQSLPESFSQSIMDSDFINGDYNLLGLLDRLISAETNMKNAECTRILLDSSKSSSISKTQVEGKTKVKKAQLKLTSGVTKAHLKAKGGITKAHLKAKGGITKAHLDSDDWHKWEKPKLGWIKLNTDGCLKGYGGLFRDHEGKPLCAYVVRSSTDDIFIAELMAVLKGISVAYVRGYTSLWVESDSQCVVRTINGEQSCPPMAAQYFDQISLIKGLFKNFKITFFWRECNKAADRLSRMHNRIDSHLVHGQLLLTPDDFPKTLRTIIKDDAGGRLYYRRTSRSTCQVEVV